ncbi:MAG: hypothetical protein OQK78_12230 [Gammaproteobacteria bacterium]|nr:hypothetical protein [Gammaproteobacteria bacterium]
MDQLAKLNKWLISLSVASFAIAIFSAFITYTQINYIGFENQGSAKVLVVGTSIVALFTIFSLKSLLTLKKHSVETTLNEVFSLFKVLTLFICALAIILWIAVYFLT